jgi:hypothetical protein
MKNLKWWNLLWMNSEEKVSCYLICTPNSGWDSRENGGNEMGRGWTIPIVAALYVS